MKLLLTIHPVQKIGPVTYLPAKARLHIQAKFII
jgi:hypothetical protein